MESEKYVVNWHGPYKLYGTKDDSVLATVLAKQKGIYLWAAPFEGKYLTYFVGETGRSFATRFLEHIRYYLYGFYRVYDPDDFVHGRKTLVWDGMWKPDRKSPEIMLEFLNRYPELSQLIYRYLGEFRIFLAPIDAQRRVRQRIEAAIAKRLLEQQGLTSEFHDHEVRYLSKRTDEAPILVEMQAFESILGLCNELQA